MTAHATAFHHIVASLEYPMFVVTVAASVLVGALVRARRRRNLQRQEQLERLQSPPVATGDANREPPAGTTP